MNEGVNFWGEKNHGTASFVAFFLSPLSETCQTRKWPRSPSFLASLDARARAYCPLNLKKKRGWSSYTTLGERYWKTFFFSTENLINPKVYHPKKSKKLPLLHLEGNASFLLTSLSNTKRLFFAYFHILVNAGSLVLSFLSV